ncbi:MAG: Type pilus assembly protein PilM [Candidatus Berkelbacteria bacterium]|nr:Type pilus assembly protein PilM [Candidatus Berkelbacteria bacterium]
MLGICDLPDEGGLLDISALEINEYFIRAIKLGRTGNNLTIQKIAEINLPEGVILNSRLIKGQDFAQILGNFLKKNHFSSPNWVVSLCEGPIYTTHKIFPNIQTADLDEAVDINSASLLPGDTKNISWGWQEVEPLEKISGKEVMVSSIPKNELNQYLAVFSQIGIIPIAIEPKSCSTARVFAKTDNTLIVNLEGSIVSYTIIKNGFARFARESRIVQKPSDQFKNLVSEIRQVMNFYLTEKKQDKIEKIILDGSGARPELVMNLKKTLNIEVVISSELLQIGGFRVSFMPLVGAGIRALFNPKDDMSLSLLPVGAKEATEERRTLLFYGGLANMIVTVCILFLIIFFASIGFLSYLDKNLSSQLETVSKSKAQLSAKDSQTQQQVSEIKNILSTEATIENQITYWSSVLKGIQSFVTSEITLSQVNSQTQDAVTIIGVAQSRDALVAFRDALSAADFVSSVQLPSSNFSDTKNINFTINLSINKDSLKQP